MFRLKYYTKGWLGLTERLLPVSTWNAEPLKKFLKDPNLSEPKAYFCYRHERAPNFHFSPEQRKEFKNFFTKWDSNDTNPIFYANQIGEGKFRYFAHKIIKIGFPPNWHLNPFSNLLFPLICMI